MKNEHKVPPIDIDLALFYLGNLAVGARAVADRVTLKMVIKNVFHAELFAGIPTQQGQSGVFKVDRPDMFIDWLQRVNSDLAA